MSQKFFIAILMSFCSLSHAGPFVGGGNGAMPLAYCSNHSGDTGIEVSWSPSGVLTGFSWTADGVISERHLVKVRPSSQEGTPHEKPLILRGKDFVVQVSMSNLPATVGAPFDRGGRVSILRNQKWISQQMPCTFFGIEKL
jgi:hypothetical protein